MAGREVAEYLAIVLIVRLARDDQLHAFGQEVGHDRFHEADAFFSDQTAHEAKEWGCGIGVEAARCLEGGLVLPTQIQVELVEPPWDLIIQSGIVVAETQTIEDAAQRVPPRACTAWRSSGATSPAVISVAWVGLTVLKASAARMPRAAKLI